MIFIVIQPAKLTSLAKECLENFESKKDLSYVVKSSMPILYFGNIKKYFDSPIRIVTVGLNPSKKEFPDPDPFLRFQSMKKDQYYDFNQQYLAALNEYFQDKPYKEWFDPAYEPLLNGLNASFYGNMENTAIHTDICSSLATTQTWETLSKEEQRKLEADSVQLWHKLIDYLEPDVILLSVAGEHLSKIRFETINDWETVYTTQMDRPYLLNSKRIALSSGKQSSIYFGRAAELPFGFISSETKYSIGKHLKKLTEKQEYNPAFGQAYMFSALNIDQNDSEIFG